MEKARVTRKALLKKCNTESDEDMLNCNSTSTCSVPGSESKGRVCVDEKSVMVDQNKIRESSIDNNTSTFVEDEDHSEFTDGDNEVC